METNKNMPNKIIIDTDIGADIDDTWALVLALKDPAFDIRLISVTEGGVSYKAELVAKILTELGRTDIPIAIGEEHGEVIFPQKKYVEDFTLRSYKGKIFRDYRQAYENILSDLPKITVAALAPNSTLGKIGGLLKKADAEVVAMAGAVHVGYFGRKDPEPECNIVSNLDMTRALFDSGVRYTMLPLDVCNDIRITGSRYSKVFKSNTKAAVTVMQNYRIWDEEYQGGSRKYGFLQSSTTLYDFAPFWYLMFPELFEVKKICMEIDANGITKEGHGREMQVALSLFDLDFLLDYSVNRITS